MLKLLAVLSLVALPVMDSQADNFELKTDKQKASYAIGQQIGSQIKAQGVALDQDALTASIKDALNGESSRLSQQEMMTAMLNLQKEMQEKQAKEGEVNKAAGMAFLKENKSKKGVVETASGLQYVVLKEGNGPSPKPSDSVKVHYRGTLLDGTEFDSSYSRNKPAEFPLQGVIKGWTEGIPTMKVGGKTKFFIPSDLAYGDTGRPSIPPSSLLVFEVELLEIK
jgi:FKBP-type peptidyl-prolyl cis-trans isomerase FkpA/FKBP-type peptidyl-prolyl cis-trans isomerase FklB